MAYTQVGHYCFTCTSILQRNIYLKPTERLKRMQRRTSFFLQSINLLLPCSRSLILTICGIEFISHRQFHLATIVPIELIQIHLMVVKQVSIFLSPKHIVTFNCNLQLIVEEGLRKTDIYHKFIFG